MSSALSPALKSLSVSPVVQFPKEAEAGKTYLFTIDLSPRQSFATWPYPDSEEVIIYCLINAAPLFSCEALGEPAVVIHRFGGTYGPARFLITAAAVPQDGIIRITLVNGRGVPLTTFETPTISVRSQVDIKQPLDLRVGPRVRKTATSRDSVPEINLAEVNVPEVSPPVSTPKSADEPAKVFVSWSYSDLKGYREIVLEVLRSMQKQVVVIDQFVAARPTLEKPYEGVNFCDLYVGIFGWRYGYVPRDDNPDGKSVTELEYRGAIAHGKPCLIFLADEKQPWPGTRAEPGPELQRIMGLRRELIDNHSVNYFENPDDLAAKVFAAVSKWLEQKDTDKPSPPVTELAPTVKVEDVPNLTIPDNQATGVTRVLSVNNDGRCKRLTVSVDIAHTYIGDLLVKLTSPTGKTAVLHNRSGGSADNLVTTYRSEDFPPLAALLGDEAKGEWQLQVADLSSEDVGTLRRCGLEMSLEETTQTMDPEAAYYDDVPSLQLPPDSISISRLPVSGKNFLARESELRMLDEAWNSGTNVLSIIGWGGAGKSVLVNQWLSRMAEDNYRGAERVYGWSFYEQGTTELAGSADLFIHEALKFFGDEGLAQNAASAWDKGLLLAHLIGLKRTLLVLDGLQALQYPPGPEEGKLKDPALQGLLRQLAAHNEGLCLITSRVAVTDLDSFEGKTALRIDLVQLSPHAGAEMLRAQGVKGTQEELEQASIDYAGHPLSLALLGSYLTTVYGGDITRRGQISSLEKEEQYGPHAQRLMASYERWFGEGPELAVLRLLSLFDRPASQGELDALRAAPVIPGLTEALVNLDDLRWQSVLAVLLRARLMMATSGAKAELVTTHPLVREHFVRQLTHRPDAWREGHNRLYEHLVRSTKELPDTLEEMAPLYTAIHHGCQAGRHQEVFDEVYRKRIQRDNELYSLYKLGAFGQDLTALSNFFEKPWIILVAGLSDSSRNFILNTTSYALRSLGRLVEATEPTRASLESNVTRQNWLNASVDADNLATLYVTLGDISNAFAFATQAIDIVDRTSNRERSGTHLATLGCVLHQAGRISESEAAFREAEARQRPHKLLSSVEGFQYCELLLDLGRPEDVQDRAAQMLERARESGNFPDAALSLLSMCRASLLSHEKGSDQFARAVQLDDAVKILRQTGQIAAFLPYGLLARAELHRRMLQFDRARIDLDEALSFATRGSMKLHEADCHLAFARLFLAMEERQSARESLEQARQIIEETGYHRRDKDLSEIERQLSETLDEAVPTPSPARNGLFIAYSHVDKKWLKRLTTFLKPVVRDEEISLWDDTAIKPGADWNEEYKKALSSAKVAVLLVSANFLASDFIRDQLQSPLLAAAEKNELRVLWVALSPSMFSRTPLNKFQAANDPSKPLSTLTGAKRDRELVRIVEAVHSALEL